MRTSKKERFAKLDISSVTDNKSFWQTLKPLFSNKVKSPRILNLVEKDTLIDHNEKITKISNEHFVNIVQKLGKVSKKSNIKPTELHLDEINGTIIKYENNTSIKAIKNRMVELNNLTFSSNCREEIVIEIVKLYNKKASQNTDILVNIIQETIDLISYFLRHNFINSLAYYCHEISRCKTNSHEG